ncbi:hypothetical protein C8R42DRAFT_717844 [Lentinula raphanica]|nr:hypothetical protein C8R42DRAFT_717844 [Lentinula raphanica]
MDPESPPSSLPSSSEPHYIEPSSSSSPSHPYTQSRSPSPSSRQPSSQTSHPCTPPLSCSRLSSQRGIKSLPLSRSSSTSSSKSKLPLVLELCIVNYHIRDDTSILYPPSSPMDLIPAHPSSSAWYQSIHNTHVLRSHVEKGEDTENKPASRHHTFVRLSEQDSEMHPADRGNLPLSVV